jgi:tRNA pseudouridine38-40 synthase
MRNLKLTLHYDGTNYHGWQIQTNAATIQGHLTSALATICNADAVACTGASRTDAGVHALGQVANVRLPGAGTLTCQAVQRGLNSLTPPDIVIADVQDVRPDFHARFDARAKTYCYQIFNASVDSVYHQRFSWHIRHPLRLEAMRAAARHLVGCHDFAAFQAASCSADTSIRTVFGLHIVQHKTMLRCVIKANAYLHRMVRNIVGTLVEVGLDRRAPEDVAVILRGKDRRQAGVTAPAQGLFLVRVHY